MSDADNESSDDVLDWEEWDGSGHFWQHCVAGSIAGVSEHTLTYPFDTVKTHLQACADCPQKATATNGRAAVKQGAQQQAQHSLSNSLRTASSSPAGSGGMWTTMRHIVSQAGATAELANGAGTATATTMNGSRSSATITCTAAGMTRLFRGVQTIVVGCIPAHALYFSTYEATKHAFLMNGGNGNSNTLSAQGGMVAGAAASFSHDVIMTPLDTIKQRLQLGHYQGMMDALHHMIRLEGYACLFRSFPITLLTNVPYGAIMVSTNEVVKQRLMAYRQHHHCNDSTVYYNQAAAQPAPLPISTCLLASSMGGMVASATTTPLDRIKTFLQTQQLQPACPHHQGSSCPKQVIGNSAAAAGAAEQPMVYVGSWRQAVHLILEKQGPSGLFRGMVPRVIAHTPAVAISWTTYETAKQWLLAMSNNNNA